MGLWEIVDNAAAESGYKPSYVQGARRPGGSWLIVTWTRPTGRKIVYLRTDEQYTYVMTMLHPVKRVRFERAAEEEIGAWIAEEVLS